MRRFLGGVTAGLAVGVTGLGALSMMTDARDVVGEVRVPAAAPPAPTADTAPVAPIAGELETVEAAPPNPTLPGEPVGEASIGSGPSVAPSALEEESLEHAEQAGGSSEEDAIGAEAPPTEVEAPAPASGAVEVQVADPVLPRTEMPEGAAVSLITPLEGGAGLEPAVAPTAPAPLEPATPPSPPLEDAAPKAAPMQQAVAPVVASADPAPEPLPAHPAPVVSEAVAGPGPVTSAQLPAVPAHDLARHNAAKPASPSAPVAEAGPEPIVDAPSAPEVTAKGPSALALAPAAPEASAPAAESLASVQPRPASPSSDAAPDTLPEQEPPASAAPSAMPGRITLQGAAFPGREAVRVNRLGLEPAADETPAEPVPEASAEDAPALRRFAAPWEPPAEPLPRMAFVLLDDGNAAPDMLASLPVPVSVAIDASVPGAAGRMAALRAAGLEVLVLASLPPNPRPTDVEVFLSPALQALPEAVGVLDLGQGGLRGRDATAEMVLSRLARDGLGAVLVSGGLGRGAEGAEAAGVPAAEILRDIDGADVAAIGRQLDDGARRARQEGEAVLLARPNPQTLEALAGWIAEREAESVAVAPVSAVLAP